VLYREKIIDNSSLGNVTIPWKKVGNYESVEYIPLKKVSVVVAADVHPDSMKVRQKIDDYKQLLALKKLDLIITLADVKAGTVIIDGAHRAISYYEHNIEGNNAHIDLNVYHLKPAFFWRQLERLYRLYLRFGRRLLGVNN